MATDFGADLSCVSDLDPHFTVVTGITTLKQELLHAVTTPRGTLWYDTPDGPNYGIDVRDYLNAPWSTTLSTQMAADIQRAFLRNRKVLAATVNCTYSALTSTVTVTAIVGTAQGPFTFVISVSALAVSML